MEIPQNILKELEDRKSKALLDQNNTNTRMPTNDANNKDEEEPSLAAAVAAPERQELADPIPAMSPIGPIGPIAAAPILLEERGKKTGGELFFGFVAKLSVFLAVFLTPLFFFASSDTVNLPKQLLLSVLALTGVMAWVIQSIAAGQVTWKKSFILGPMFLAALAAVFSSVFSSSFWVSFLGDTGRYASSGLSLLSYLILAVVALQSLEGREGQSLHQGLTLVRRDVHIVLGLWLVSSALVSVFALLQFLGIFIFKSYANPVFNTIGTVFELPLFILMTVPLALAWAPRQKKLVKIILYALAVLHLVVAALVDFRVGWFGLMGAAFILLLAGLKKREERGEMGRMGQTREISRSRTSVTMLPLALLMAAVLLWFVNVPAPKNLSIPPEVSPSYQASFSVLTQSLKNHLVFGSGLETFSYEYAKFKSAVLNQTNFWGVNFSNSNSGFIDWGITGGLFGLVSILIYSIWFFIYAWRRMGSRGEMGQKGLEEGLLASWVFILVTKFFYATPLAAELFFWLIPVLFVLAHEQKGEMGETGGKGWGYQLQTGSAKTIAIFFVLLIVLLSGLAGEYFSVRRWQAETIFVKAVSADNSAEKRDQVANGIYSAITADPYEPRYFRVLSQVLFAKLNDIFAEVQKREPSARQLKPEEGVLVQNLTVRNINAVQRAVSLDPANVAVFVDAAEAYRNLVPLVKGADDLAIQNYERASELEPINPFIKTQLGQLYLLKSNLFNANSPADATLVDKARAVLEKALELNPDYANARYFLALIYDKDGKKDLALQNFLFLRQTNPDNKLIGEIVGNLQNGWPALGNPPAPAVPPQSPRAAVTKGVPPPKARN